MKLFKLIDDLPVPSDEARTLKEFRTIITRDKGSKGDHDGRKKKIAIKELAFVHWYCTFDSRFEAYPTEEERNEAIKVAVGLPEDWQPDADIRAAIGRYSDMLQTDSTEFVKSLKKGLTAIQRTISDYNDPIIRKDPETDEEIEENKVLNVRDAKALSDLISNSPKTLQALIDAKKVVEKELQDKFGGDSKKVRAMINDLVDSQKLEGGRI